MLPHFDDGLFQLAGRGFDLESAFQDVARVGLRQPCYDQSSRLNLRVGFREKRTGSEP